MSTDQAIAERMWVDSYPDITAFEVSTDDMISPELFAKERDRVFRKAWLFAGLTRDLDRPGSYLVRDFASLKASVILVRGKDDQIRGFHNVCRHRCNKLLDNTTRPARADAFVCEYHGWTYDLQGRLTDMPDPDGVMNAEGLGLARVHTETWSGFIFVNFDPRPRQTLREFLGEAYDGALSKYDFDQPMESWTWSTEVKANWKVVLDLFSESYHLRFVHQESVRRLYSNKENPFGHYAALRFYGLHRHSSVFGSLQQKIGPLGQLTLKFGGGGMSRYRNKDVVKAAAPGTNPEKLENWGFDSHTIFPNLQIAVFGTFWHYHYFQPLAADRMLWEHRISFPKAKNAGARFAQEYSRSLQQIVAAEDGAVAESNQAGLESGVMPFMMLHDQEIKIRHTRQALAQFMADGQGEGK